ncbi:MAG TPA: hypothetical protein DCZ40_06820 [Lachnospiraceae bacterium]|nr:hypothetical protein [Lachnospiraceae bacterium]
MLCRAPSHCFLWSRNHSRFSIRKDRYFILRQDNIWKFLPSVESAEQPAGDSGSEVRDNSKLHL